MKTQKQHSGIYPKPSEIHNSSDTMLFSIYTFSIMYGAMTHWLPDYQLRACDSNHRVTPRATLPFILLRSIKQVPGTPRDLGLK